MMRIKSDKRGRIKKTIPVWQQRFTGELLPKQSPNSQFPVDLPTAGLLLWLSWNYSSVSITSKCRFFHILLACQLSKKINFKAWSFFTSDKTPIGLILSLKKRNLHANFPQGQNKMSLQTHYFPSWPNHSCVEGLQATKVALTHFQHICILQRSYKWVLFYFIRGVFEVGSWARNQISWWCFIEWAWPLRWPTYLPYPHSRICCLESTHMSGERGIHWVLLHFLSLRTQGHLRQPDLAC